MKVMLDLETMGNSSNAAIIAIGAVAFDDERIVSKFYSEINLQSAIDCGGIVDGATIMWWLNGSEASREAFKYNEEAPTLIDALSDFSAWYRVTRGSEVWGNGAAFDNIILANAYRNNSLEVPWKFWNDRCYRTVKSMYSGVEFGRIGTHHNALDDAESQAIHLMKIISLTNNFKI